MPAILPQIADELQKRYCSYNSYGYCNSGGSSLWWLFFLLVLPVLAFLCLCCRRRNVSRRSQGLPPVPYTGWTAYQFNNNNNQQQYQEPYYESKPEDSQYNGGNTGTYTQPPAYGQDQTYQRPDGPPPGSDQYNTGTQNTTGVPDYQSPQAPQNTYTRS